MPQTNRLQCQILDAGRANYSRLGGEGTASRASGRPWLIQLIAPANLLRADATRPVDQAFSTDDTMPNSLFTMIAECLGLASLTAAIGALISHSVTSVAMAESPENEAAVVLARNCLE